MQRRHDQVSDLYHALDTMAAKLDKLREDVQWKVLFTEIQRNPTSVHRVERHFAWNEMKTVIEHMADALIQLESVSRASKTGAFYRGIYSGFVGELCGVRALKAETCRAFGVTTAK